MVRVDYVDPLPVTPGGNCYILLFTDRFSRRADLYGVSSAAEFTAKGTADILVNKHAPLRGCPVSFLSDNGQARLLQPVTCRFNTSGGMRKNTTSAYHPNGNGAVVCVNHTIAQMLAIVCNERQD